MKDFLSFFPDELICVFHGGNVDWADLLGDVILAVTLRPHSSLVL